MSWTTSCEASISVFSAPSLDGTTSVAVEFAADHSSLDTNSSRMLSSLGTRFFATPAHARPTLGAPIPSGPRLLDASGFLPIADAVHVGTLNQALHALWRDRYFDGSRAAGGRPATVSSVTPGRTSPPSALPSNVLSVLNPALGTNADHMILEGTFGIR